jgi:hypothetical protein
VVISAAASARKVSMRTAVARAALCRASWVWQACMRAGDGVSFMVGDARGVQRRGRPVHAHHNRLTIDVAGLAELPLCRIEVPPAGRVTRAAAGSRCCSEPWGHGDVRLSRVSGNIVKIIRLLPGVVLAALTPERADHPVGARGPECRR